jgi:hypothetical protein
VYLCVYDVCIVYVTCVFVCYIDLVICHRAKTHLQFEINQIGRGGSMGVFPVRY